MKELEAEDETMDMSRIEEGCGSGDSGPVSAGWLAPQSSPSLESTC